MAHLYRMSEWQDGNGKWMVNDVEEVSAAPGYWWYPARLLGVTCAEYVKLLHTKYHAQNIWLSESGNVLVFFFNELADARKFKNELNALARKKNFIIGDD